MPIAYTLSSAEELVERAAQEVVVMKGTFHSIPQCTERSAMLGEFQLRGEAQKISDRRGNQTFVNLLIKMSRNTCYFLIIKLAKEIRWAVILECRRPSTVFI